MVTIGGADAGDRNVIAFNTQNGILINSNFAYPGSGVVDSVVGNAILSNGGPGISLLAGVSDQFSQNAIYSNAAPGIDINNPNSASNTCQADASGPNNNQNAPQLTPASGGQTLVSATAIDPYGNTSQFSNCAPMAVSAGTLNILGQLNSLPNTAYAIEFFQNAVCDPSGYGRGGVPFEHQCHDRPDELYRYFRDDGEHRDRRSERGPCRSEPHPQQQYHLHRDGSQAVGRPPAASVSATPCRPAKLSSPPPVPPAPAATTETW